MFFELGITNAFNWLTRTSPSSMLLMRVCSASLSAYRTSLCIFVRMVTAAITGIFSNSVVSHMEGAWVLLPE